MIKFWLHLTLTFDLEIYFSILDGGISTGHTSVRDINSPRNKRCESDSIDSGVGSIINTIAHFVHLQDTV